jgi:signal transduction histidine kinase
MAAWLVVIAGLLVAVAAEAAAFAGDAAQPWACAVAAGLTVLPLLILGRSPIKAWRWMTVGLASFALVAGPAHGWAWSPTGLVLYGVVLMLVGAASPTGSLAAGVWIWSVLALWFSGWGVSQWVVAALATAFALFAMVGNLWGGRSRARQELAQTSAERDAASAQQAVMAERARIARELHDVVAHHMSMIAIQAEAAILREPNLPPATVASLGLIRNAAREALHETRGIVGLLRGGESAAEREPAPGIEQLQALADAARASGLEVELVADAVPEALPAATGLTVYRIVQEALANAARHAPGAAVLVTVHQRADELSVTVRNGPPAKPDLA